MHYAFELIRNFPRDRLALPRVVLPPPRKYEHVYAAVSYIVFVFFFFSFTISQATVSHPTLIFPVDRHDRHRLANACTASETIYVSFSSCPGHRRSVESENRFSIISPRLRSNVNGCREGIERHLVRTRICI